MVLFTGNRPVSGGPYLTLEATQVRQEVGNNRSLVRLVLRLETTYRISYSATKSGSLDGTSFSHGGASGTGGWQLASKEVWVNHDSAGNGSKSASASFNIDITYSGTRINTLTVSGKLDLTTIPRASDFTAFDLDNNNMLTSTARTIKYTLNRKSPAFSQQMTLRLGNKQIASWSTTGTGALTRSLTSAEVNEVLKGLPNSTSGTLTLTMQTKSGTSNIGSAIARTFHVVVHPDVMPTASGMSTSIAGTGRDSAIGKYVQSISKVTASFTSGAGYGATVRGNSITIRRETSNTNAQNLSGTSATTSNPVALTGWYEAIGTIVDSRGRAKQTISRFHVEPYSPPRINDFSVARNNSTSTTVNTNMNATWTPLGTSNPATIRMTRTPTGGTASNLYAPANSTTGSLNVSQNYTGNLDTTSYVFVLTVTDSFGNVARSEQVIGTSFQELTIARGKGVGIGKVHERGSLDVDGEIYFNDRLIGQTQRFNEHYPNGGDDSHSFWHNIREDSYFVSQGQLTNQPTSFGIMDVKRHGVEYNAIWYQMASGETWRKSGNHTYNYGWEPFGRPYNRVNENGTTLRFGDGTQICFHRVASVSTNANGHPPNYPFPSPFVDNPALFYSGFATDNSGSMKTPLTSVSNSNIWTPRSFYTSGITRVLNLGMLAIGRWK